MTDILPSPPHSLSLCHAVNTPSFRAPRLALILHLFLSLYHSHRTVSATSLIVQRRQEILVHAKGNVGKGSKEKYYFKTLTLFKKKTIYLIGRNVPNFHLCCDYSKHVLESRNLPQIFQFYQIRCFVPKKSSDKCVGLHSHYHVAIAMTVMIYGTRKRLFSSLQAQSEVPQPVNITECCIQESSDNLCHLRTCPGLASIKLTPFLLSWQSYFINQNTLSQTTCFS